MSKRNHTHIQVVLPEIKAMLAEGKAQREVASYYRFLINMWGNICWHENAGKNENRNQGSFLGPKDGQGKTPCREILQRSRPMRSGSCAWKTSCCGIFCDSWEGSDAEGKMPHHLSAQSRVSSNSYVQIL